jgi:hypothetical protein
MIVLLVHRKWWRVSIIVQMCMVLLEEKFLVENDEQHYVMTFLYRRLRFVLMDAIKINNDFPCVLRSIGDAP